VSDIVAGGATLVEHPPCRRLIWPARRLLERGLDLGVLHETIAAGGTGVNGLIYLIGLIVVVLFILSFLGLR
jgi:hypothetical protein